MSGDPALELSFRRRSHPEEKLASAAVSLNGGEWKRYDFELTLETGILSRLEPADFVIAAMQESRVLLDQVLLFPSDHVDGMDPEMIAMSRALRSPIVRFGGNYTSAYHWRDGIGPVEKRISTLNLAWGMPEYNHFGTDEFLRFCKLINAEPQIVLNLGTGTPEEAADWVRYVNERWNGARGGLLWELGNELWGAFQHGYPTLGRIAPLTREFSAAVRKADARARLIGTGQDPDPAELWESLLDRTSQRCADSSLRCAASARVAQKRRPTPISTRDSRLSAASIHLPMRRTTSSSASSPHAISPVCRSHSGPT